MICYTTQHYNLFESQLNENFKPLQHIVQNVIVDCVRDSNHPQTKWKLYGKETVLFLIQVCEADPEMYR